MRISTSTLRALASQLASSYPFTTHMIFMEGRRIATENNYKRIVELQRPLINSLDEMALMNGRKTNETKRRILR
ncbi:hypothetical protein [Enterococcus faecium]|uniref:hypothetical protein n=1 Tax=Enterococcus faecium TaxID=1352 RepID=UPI0019EF14D2|nr:hypothetical protein [Enterococcus faecium]EGP5214226.1 hypothetical protein [Enterococcus faecium]